jgi:hypothetical protein
LFLIASLAPILSIPFSGDTQAPDYLSYVSANTAAVTTGALFEVIMALAIPAIAITMYPVLKHQNSTLALGYVGARIIEGVLLLAATIGLLLLISIGSDPVEPGASYSHQMSTLVLWARDWSGHVLSAIVFGLGGIVFYYLLYQSRRVPRWLSIWGLIGAPLAIIEGVVIMFGIAGPFSPAAVALNVPIGVNELVLAVWLIVNGFNSSAINQHDQHT